MEVNEYEAEVFQFLTDLRDGGSINMYAAPGVLSDVYGIPKADAVALFFKWVDSLEESE